jgi:hypothetical protein
VVRAGENRDACWKATRSAIVEVAWMVLLARDSTEEEGVAREVTGAGGGNWVGGRFGDAEGRSKCQSLPVAEERCPWSRVVPLSWMEAVVASK